MEDMSYNAQKTLKPFRAWIQKVLPQVYDDALSYQELVYKLLYYINTLIEQIDTEAEINADLQKQLNELKDIINGILSGEGDYDILLDKLADYIDKNLATLCARIVQYIFPTLMYDGKCWRYQIDVPTLWEFLSFVWYFDDDDHTYHLSLNMWDKEAQEVYHDIQHNTDEINQLKELVKELYERWINPIEVKKNG